MTTLRSKLIVVIECGVLIEEILMIVGYLQFSMVSLL